MDFSVIVPVFKGQKTIRLLCEKIKSSLQKHYSYEILLIDDSGNGHNLHAISGLVSENPGNVRGFILGKNYGQHKAILFGFGQAKGEIIITIDEDLQHDPNDIEKLRTKQEEGDFDVVYAKFQNSKHPYFRKLFSSLFRKIVTIMIPHLFYDYSPYRLIRKSVVEKTLNIEASFVFIDDYLSRVTKSISCVSVEHHERTSKSSYNFLKFFQNGVLLVLAYSRLVLYLFLFSGLFLTAGVILFELPLEYLNSEHTDLALLFLIVGLSFLTTGLPLLILKNQKFKEGNKSVEYTELQNSRICEK